MRSEKKCALWIGVLLMLFPLAASATEINAKMRAEDTRLEKPVTLHERRIYLGELLAKLRVQTGIDLSINEKLPLSGVQVTVHCTQTPVGSVLNSLWSLLSNREAEWTWIRLPEAGTYRYDFAQTAQAREKAARFSQYAQRVFEDYIAVMKKFALMSPEERKRQSAQLAKATYQKNDDSVTEFIESENVWNRVRLFTEAIPADLQWQVIRGQKEAKIPVSDLPQPMQDLFNQACAGIHHATIIDGKEIPVPAPKVLRFYPSERTGSGRMVVPAVSFDTGNNTGITCLGSYYLDKGVIAHIKQLWQMPGDAETDAMLTKVVPPEAKPDPLIPDQASLPHRVLPTGKTIYASIPHALDLWLLLLARSASVPMMEILPLDQGDPGSPIKKTVGEFLEKAESKTPNPMWKWRDGMLLVSYPLWFLEEESVVPYKIIKEFALNPTQIFSLVRMAKLMTTLTEGQAQSLSEEYPAIGAALQLYPAFGLSVRSPEILTVTGMTLTPDVVSLLLTLPLPHLDSLKDGSATAVRFREDDLSGSGSPKVLSIRLEAKVGEKWVLLDGFVQSTN